MNIFAALNQYDWRLPEKAAALDAYAKEIQGLIDSPDAERIVEMFRLGTYLQHHQKKPDDAAKVLKFAYDHLLDLPEELQPLLTNNLAYALVNCRQGRVDDVEILGYLDESVQHLSADLEARCFAKRIKGQIFFAQSKEAGSEEGRSALLQKGISQCLEGVEGMDVNISQQLTEIARTYNRNGVEILLFSNVYPRLEFVESGIEQSSHALKLWEEHSAPDEFREYKARTCMTLGELHLKKYELAGDLKNLNSAQAYLSRAVKDLTGADQARTQGQLDVVAETKEVLSR